MTHAALTTRDPPPPSRTRKLLVAGGLAALGGICGYALADAAEGLALSWQDTLAAGIALALAVGALAGAVAVLLRKSPVRSACAWWQVAGMGLAALMLTLPLARPASWPPEFTLAVVALLFLAQAGVNLALWRAGDELLRRVILETGAVCFWSLQAGLFLYAAAERLGLVPSVTAWGLIGVLMGVYLVASCIVAGRRGFS